MSQNPVATGSCGMAVCFTGSLMPLFALGFDSAWGLTDDSVRVRETNTGAVKKR